MEEVEDMSLDFTSLTILKPGKDDRSLTILNTEIRDERGKKYNNLVIFATIYEKNEQQIAGWRLLINNAIETQY